MNFFPSFLSSSSQIAVSLSCLKKLRSDCQTTAATPPPPNCFVSLNKPDISSTCCDHPQIGKQHGGPAGQLKPLDSPLCGVIVAAQHFPLSVVSYLFVHIVSPPCHSSAICFSPFVLPPPSYFSSSPLLYHHSRKKKKPNLIAD